MVIVRAAITNAAAARDPTWISNSDFHLIGSQNVRYSTYGQDSGCGVVPDLLTDGVYRGGTVEGNVCFQIPDVEVDLRLLYEYAWDEYLFFAVE
jgi:hypothetical protein